MTNPITSLINFFKIKEMDTELYDMGCNNSVPSQVYKNSKTPYTLNISEKDKGVPYTLNPGKSPAKDIPTPTKTPYTLNVTDKTIPPYSLNIEEEASKTPIGINTETGDLVGNKDGYVAVINPVNGKATYVKSPDKKYWDKYLDPRNNPLNKCDAISHHSGTIIRPTASPSSIKDLTLDNHVYRDVEDDISQKQDWRDGCQPVPTMPKQIRREKNV